MWECLHFNIHSFDFPAPIASQLKESKLMSNKIEWQHNMDIPSKGRSNARCWSDRPAGCSTCWLSMRFVISERKRKRKRKLLKSWLTLFFSLSWPLYLGSVYLSWWNRSTMRCAPSTIFLLLYTIFWSYTVLLRLRLESSIPDNRWERETF